jgi:hypothetical protein
MGGDAAHQWSCVGHFFLVLRDRLAHTVAAAFVAG